jgi:hypothetical protein
MKRNYKKPEKPKFQKTPNSNLDRFRNDIAEFTKTVSGLSVPINKINSNSKKLSRKELRRLERKLKGAKKEAFFKKEKVDYLIFRFKLVENYKKKF